MKEAANGVLASLTPSTYQNSTPQSFARCGLVRDLFDRPGRFLPSKGKRSRQSGPPAWSYVERRTWGRCSERTGRRRPDVWSWPPCTRCRAGRVSQRSWERSWIAMWMCQPWSAFSLRGREFVNVRERGEISEINIYRVSNVQYIANMHSHSHHSQQKGRIAYAQRRGCHFRRHLIIFRQGC